MGRGMNDRQMKVKGASSMCQCIYCFNLMETLNKSNLFIYSYKSSLLTILCQVAKRYFIVSILIRV